VFTYFPWITSVQTVGDRPKSDLGSALEFLIDDGAHHFVAGTFPGILLDYRHNRDIPVRENVIRVQGPNYWENILQVFLEKGWL
jgi:5'(3')-deoxyribonucleotidase